MKTGRLVLYIEHGNGLYGVFDENGERVQCETYKRMEELKEKYKHLLKEGEVFRVEENW